MPVVNVLPPIQHSNTFGTVGHAFLFAAERIRLELQDRLSLTQMNVIALRGDVAGTGTDTLRITDYGNVGFSLPMQALATETDTVAASLVRLGFETVTVGQFGVSHSETYKHQALSREPAIGLDQLKMLVPDSWERTFRDQIAITGSGIVTAVGTAATTLSVDDHLDLITAFRTNLGNTRPFSLIDPTQIDQLQRSYRNEPAFTNTSGDFASLLGLVTGGQDPSTVTQMFPNFAGMGIDFATTDSIVQSGGAFQGFAFPFGGIGWAVSSTGPVIPANTVGAIRVPQFGLIIEELTEGGAQTTRQYRATAFFGTALGSTRVHTLRRVISLV